MDDAFDAALRVDDEQRGDFALLEQLQRRRGELVRFDRHGIFFHARGGALFQDLFVAFEKTPQIAVADDALEHTAVARYRGDAESFFRHFVDHVAHRRRHVDDRNLLAAVHQIADAKESLAELSARMKKGEVFFAKTFSQ